MLKQSILKTIPKVDYYLTHGTSMGRIVACKKPFYRGNGVYHLSMMPEHWEVQGGGPLSPEELEAFKQEIRDQRVAALRDSVRLNAHLGYHLVEDPKWVFQLVKNKG